MMIVVTVASFATPEARVRQYLNRDIPSEATNARVDLRKGWFGGWVVIDLDLPPDAARAFVHEVASSKVRVGGSVETALSNDESHVTLTLSGGD